MISWYINCDIVSVLINDIPLDDLLAFYFIQGQEIFDLHDAWFVRDKVQTKGRDTDGGP